MILLSPIVLTIVTCLLLLLHVVRRISSPLWKIPGPISTGLSSLPLKWNEFKTYRTRYIHSLHLRYGPVVRIAPHEVSFTSPDALKEIYCSSGSGYDKTEFYELFRQYGRRSLFTFPAKADHAKRRRALADRWANTNIMRDVSIHGVQQRSNKFIQRCANASPAADVYLALHSYACDSVTHHLFEPHGTNCLQKQQDEDMMFQVTDDSSSQNRLILYWSPTLHKVFSSVLRFFAAPRETPLADKYVMDASKLNDSATFTLLSKLTEEKHGLDITDIAAECADHMAAGIDTTGDGLTFLLWELSQPRSAKIQDKLYEELRANPAKSFEALPYLDAVICEGLRCFPPLPMSLPRYVPTSGRNIDGYWLPEKTIVSCQAWSVHYLNKDIFPNPNAFDPSRWLNTEGDLERRRLLFSFSTGGRGCVGKHLALAEMKILVRDIYASYRTTPDPSMTAESMVMSEQLISSRPVGKRCLLEFHPRY